MGCPIQRSPDHRSFASSPELFAGCHVFRRLWSPRHPPHALGRLTRQPQPLRGRASACAASVTRPSRARSSDRARLRCIALSTLLKNGTAGGTGPEDRRTTGVEPIPQRAKPRTLGRARCGIGSKRVGWWSQAGSNRRPPACKAGALPAELWPHVWWVWVDSNHRPHPYQGCALTA